MFDCGIHLLANAALLCGHRSEGIEKQDNTASLRTLLAAQFLAATCRAAPFGLEAFITATTTPTGGGHSHTTSNRGDARLTSHQRMSFLCQKIRELQQGGFVPHNVIAPLQAELDTYSTASVLVRLLEYHRRVLGKLFSIDPLLNLSGDFLALLSSRGPLSHDDDVDDDLLPADSRFALAIIRQSCRQILANDGRGSASRGMQWTRSCQANVAVQVLVWLLVYAGQKFTASIAARNALTRPSM